MPGYPKLKLKIDIKEDTSNCINFLKRERKGVKRQFVLWFLPENFKYILSKNFSEKERNKIIRESDFQELFLAKRQLPRNHFYLADVSQIS